MTYKFTYGRCGHTSGEADADSQASVPNEFCPSCSAQRREEQRAAAAATLLEQVKDNREYFIPTQEFVESLAVGDEAPCSFSQWRKVHSITHRGVDVKGVLFVCYYVEFEPGSTLSHSMKVGRLERNIGITGRHTSAELDQIEAVLNGVLAQVAA